MKQADFAIGSSVVAVYQWYVVQVEGDKPEEETEELPLIKRKWNNQFVWGQLSDKVKRPCTPTSSSRCSLPVSFRRWGVPKDTVKEVEKLYRVLWSIIYHISIYSNTFCFFRIIVT